MSPRKRLPKPLGPDLREQLTVSQKCAAALRLQAQSSDALLADLLSGVRTHANLARLGMVSNDPKMICDSLNNIDLLLENVRARSKAGQNH